MLFLIIVERAAPSRQSRTSNIYIPVNKVLHVIGVLIHCNCFKHYLRMGLKPYLWSIFISQLKLTAVE